MSKEGKKTQRKLSGFKNIEDIAGQIIRRCPNLGVATSFINQSPLYTLSNRRSSFLSGTPLRFWQRWIYDIIHIQPAASGIHDFRVEIPKLEKDASNQSVPLVRYVVRLFRGLVLHLLTLLGIDRIYKMKLNHVRTLEILDCMCKQITKDKLDRSKQVHDVVQSTISRAVELGAVEIITRMCRANEDIVHVLDKSKTNMFHRAVRFRQERVYCLLFGLKKEMRNSFLDDSRLLHSAGELSQPALEALKAIKGAALQMQRELQWFKEVEDTVPPNLLDIVKADNLTPRQRFSKDHAKLMEEGEKSMKKTATSYTVVGALILTIMFAAAFTIPGGTNEDVDYPMFVHEDLFMTFLFFDIISLFSSATSVMIFLGILTSRYAEDDFLISLPTKMILGLLTLFLSIAAMMIAFVSALLFMLHGKTWIITPVTLLACVPIASFAWMQYPLLHDLFTATYGPGIFDKNVKPWLPDM